MRRLVVAPHMDDESLGCGGLLAKYPADSAVVVLTDSGPTRRREFDRAMSVLGVSDTTLLSYADGQLSVSMTDVVTALDSLLAQH